ncbi:MAG: class I SAM-dependent methyltransferase [Devosiaceae bacterium]
MGSELTGELKTIHAQTHTVYDRVASTFDAQRLKTLFEKPWLDRFLAKLPDRPKVLDLGCGTGKPIAKYLVEQGAKLTGVDYAPSMLEIARKRFPDHMWIEGDMRALALAGQYDGVISWHGFFHLDQSEQRQSLPRLATYVRPGGALMLTVGPREGEGSGKVGGQPVYHASLDPEEYRKILTEAGFGAITIAIEDPGCDRSSIVLATNKKS